MKLQDIKNLPDEFDFISKINTITRGTIYHAVRNKQSYVITIPSEAQGFTWTETISEFNKHLKKDEYIIKNT